MKLLHIILLVGITVLGIPTYAQQQDTVAVRTVEDAIDTTLRAFRTRINDEDAVVYCVVRYYVNLNLVDFDEKNLLVKNAINAKYIDRKTQNYLLTFSIVQNELETFVNVSTSSIKKVSRKIIEFNIQSYAIPKTYRIVNN